MKCVKLAKRNWCTLLRNSWIKLSVLGAFVCCSGLAFGITRIGNTRFGSEKLGFVAEISQPFVFLNSQENDGAKLISQDSSIFRNGEVLEIKTLAEVVPDINLLTRTEFFELFTKSKGGAWNYLTATDPCVEAFAYRTKNRSIGVASWGNGQGIVFFGSGESFVSESIREMLRSLEVLPGGCKWL